MKLNMILGFIVKSRKLLHWADSPQILATQQEMEDGHSKALSMFHRIHPSNCFRLDQRWIRISWKRGQAFESFGYVNLKTSWNMKIVSGWWHCAKTKKIVLSWYYLTDGEHLLHMQKNSKRNYVVGRSCIDKTIWGLVGGVGNSKLKHA